MSEYLLHTATSTLYIWNLKLESYWANLDWLATRIMYWHIHMPVNNSRRAKGIYVIEINK